MLTMKKADYEKILAHAKENLPEEACGLIAGTKDGDKKIIEKVYLLENVDHTNEHFSMNRRNSLPQLKICVRTIWYRLATGIPIRNRRHARPRKISAWRMIRRSIT